MMISGQILDIRVTNYRACLGALRAIKSSALYRGVFRDTITALLQIARDYASDVSHYYTGQLKDSHRYRYDSHTMRGQLYVDPTMVGVDFKGRVRAHGPMVAEYAVYEHSRGGTHAFYERTMKQLEGPLMMRGVKMMTTQIDTAVQTGAAFGEVLGGD